MNGSARRRPESAKKLGISYIEKPAMLGRVCIGNPMLIYQLKRKRK